MPDWNKDRPIYRQLKEKIEYMIINGSIQEGEAVPSVRQVAGEERINPLTVSRAYQLLVDDGILEARRGLGMFVTQGAANTALVQARETFMNEEWPQICNTIRQLGLQPDTLMKNIDTKRKRLT